MANNHTHGLSWLCHDYKFIFVGIPKNASTSIRETFDIKTHDYNYFEKNEKYKDYKVFTIIRDPFRRFVSGFAEALWRNDCDETDKILKTEKNVIEQFSDFIDILVEYNRTGKEFFDCHIEKQKFYMDKIEFDYILKFETITEEFELLKKELNIPKDIMLKHENKKKNSELISILYQYMDTTGKGKNLKSKINSIYKIDKLIYDKF